MSAAGDLLPEVPAVGFPPAPGELGLRRYAQWIPVSPGILEELSMGEGGTPVINAGAELPGVSLKLEFISPTLSFKDRGAAVLIASAVERRATEVIADSSGNAGSAIAAYAARAGLRCRVFVPEATSPSKRMQIAAYGAIVEPVKGDRTATTDAAIAAVAESGALYASHIYDPFFLEGTKTYAFELFEQLGVVPDALILPVGNGTLLLGAARGFRELQLAGAIKRPPALIGVQSERCAPLAEAWRRGSTTLEPPGKAIPTLPIVAEGIAIPRPPRHAQILAAVRSSGGCIIAVREDSILPAQGDLARRGLFVEPTAAVTWAAMLMLRSDKTPADPAWRLARNLAAGRVVAPLCGAGLKAIKPPPQRP